MQLTFNEAANTDLLDHWFAVQGRDACEKYAAVARTAPAAAPYIVESYAELYEWFCSKLKRRVAEVKLQVKEVR